MRVAVLTLCRDRLAYTQHCFATLRENAGCDYDHYVLDQGSTDGTVEWLDEQYSADHIAAFSALTENIGICRGLNLLLDEELNPEAYDVIVKFDNDCELLTPDTLRDVCDVALRRNALVSPRILGLRNPPSHYAYVNDEAAPIALTGVIGGIFLAAPAHIFAGGYRHDESHPIWGGDDTALCAHWRDLGHIVGYVDGYEANHYLSTDGQVADMPEYFERRVLEGGPAR